MSRQSELRSQITSQIVAALESGTTPWRNPWRCSPNAGRPANCLSRRCYSGINPLLLELHALRFGFSSRWWGTYQQWERWGCNVKRRPDGVDPGAWGAKIVLYKPIEKTTIDEQTGDEDERNFMVMRTYTVFNAQQVEGKVIDKFLVTEPEGQPMPDYGPAEELIAATGAEINYGGDKAFYSRPTPDDSFPNHRDGDYIFVPVKERFESLPAYYETVFHELGHWSEVRLNWDWRNETYSMGELVAEMSSIFVCRELGVPDSGDLSNHASYLQSWLAAMKKDSSYIFKASTQASKVTDFLLSFVRNEEPQPEHIEVV